MEKNTIDARSARMALWAYVRWAWVPVAALVLGFAVGTLVPAGSAEESRSTQASFVVGLTNEVRWPFFDAVLARQEGLIETQDLSALASERSGVVANSVEVTSTNVQNSTLVIAVDVQGSQGDAQAFASALGELLVDANLATQRQGYLDDAADLRIEIAEQEAVVAGYDTELADLNAQWVSVQEAIVVAEDAAAPALLGQATDIDNERRAVQRRRDAAIGFETTLITQLAQVEIDGERVGAPIEISNLPSVDGTSERDLRPVFAILFFLLSLLVVPFLERRFGKARSLDQLGVAWPDAPIVDARASSTDGGVDPLEVVELMLTAGLDDGERAAVVSLADGPAIARLREIVDAKQAHCAFVDMSSIRHLESLLEADRVGIVVPTGQVALHTVRDLAVDLTALGVAPSVVALAAKSTSATTPSRPTAVNASRPGPKAKRSEAKAA